RGLQSANLQARPQNHELATLAPILKKEDGLIDFRRRSQDILNRLRGFQPWPGAFTRFRGKTLQVLSARSCERNFPAAHLTVEQDHLFVGCGQNTSLELLEVQLEGKKRMKAQDFLHGYRPHGEPLG